MALHSESDITPQPNFYAIIPATVRYDKRLCPNAKLLYGEITALTHQTGYCWATNQYFADLYGTTVRSIRSWISSLEACGHVKTQMVTAIKRRIYLPLVSPHEDDLPREEPDKGGNISSGGKKSSGGGEKIFLHNNTYTNTSIDIPNGISSPTPKKVVAEHTKEKVFYDRSEKKFKNITDEKIDKLKSVYPNIDVLQEFKKIQLWLEENPKGKRRKGGWKFILDWIARANESKEYYQSKKAKPETPPKKSEYSNFKPRKVT